MFQFLNSAFLTALAAVAIPVLIHFIARRKAVIVPFSSVRFLKTIQRQSMRSLKLRRILLLVLRSLAVAFLVLSFARPVLHSGSARIPGKAPAAVALVLDNSASMGRDALFEKAKNRMRSFLSALDPDDRFVFFETVSNRKRDTVFSGPDSEVLETVSKESATFERGRVTEIFRQGSDLLRRSGRLNRELVWISDLQASGFQEAGDSSAVVSDENRLFVLPVQGETENAGIIRCGLESRILEPDAPVTVYAEIKNFGTRNAEDILAGVFLNDAKVSQKMVTIGAGEKRRLLFQIRPEHAGWNWGSVQIDRDAFNQDNTRYFCFRIPEKIRILLVGRTSSDIRTIQAALAPEGPSDRLFEMRQSFYGDIWSGRLSAQDVVVFSNYPGFSESESGALDAYIRNGGNLFLFLGKDVQLQNYSGSSLADRFGLRFGSKEGKGGTLSFGTVDYDHPVFRGVFEPGKARVQSPRFLQLIPVAGRRLQPIVLLNNGLPLLSEIGSDRGKLLLFASGLDETWSDVAYTNIFAPMVHRGVMYLAGPDAETEADVFAGGSIRYSIRSDTLEGEYQVALPSGDRVRLVPEVVGMQISIHLDRADTPGWYRFYRGGRLLGMRCVNLDPLESDFKTVTDRKLKRMFPKTAISILSEDTPIVTSLAEARSGREFWKGALLAALVLLIAETAIARPWEKR